MFKLLVVLGTTNYNSDARLYSINGTNHLIWFL